ncbi:GDP-mannose pyrophosphatase, partial [Klebsiella pneumoniae]
VWPLEDALQAVRDGRINNAASIIALQCLALNRPEVRGLWA